MKFIVDPWDPSYGIANETSSLEPTSAEINTAVEVPATDWAAIRPLSTAATGLVLFVDGVRRVEARVWLEDGAGDVSSGLCASYAAGAVRCDGTAVVGPVLVERGLFTSSGEAESIVTSAGNFPIRLAVSDRVEDLSLALQERMGQAEVAVAEQACAGMPADLVVIDGPLRGRQHLAHAVGYVKTHHVAYLPPELHAMIGRLDPGERTPLFVLGTGWSRLAWYMALPGKREIPWAGIVRCECSADLPISQASALADRAATTLPDFASESHKEPRAPQNLYPIAGLERELRRRLGDSHVFYRALRRSAHVSVAA